MHRHLARLAQSLCCLTLLAAAGPCTPSQNPLGSNLRLSVPSSVTVARGASTDVLIDARCYSTESTSSATLELRWNGSDEGPVSSNGVTVGALTRPEGGGPAGKELIRCTTEDPTDARQFSGQGTITVRAASTATLGETRFSLVGTWRARNSGDDDTAAVELVVVVVPSTPQDAELRITREGEGRVTSSVPGIDCGATCAARYPPGTPVTLTAVADPGWRFEGFTGDADCQDGAVIIGTEQVRCTATFTEQARQWLPVGEALNVGAVPSDASSPALALDTANRPVVAWTESEHLYVKRWTGTAWQQLGPALELAPEGLGEPSLALDAAGQPWVAWHEREDALTPSRNVSVKRWDGASWQLVGGSPLDTDPSRDASQPHLVFHAGRPVVAWVEELPGAAGTALVVRAWSGSAWVDPAPSGWPTFAAGAQRFTPRLASAPTGLFLAWLDGLTQVRLEELPDTSARWEARTSLPMAVASLPAVALVWSPAQELLLAVQPTGAMGRNFTVNQWRGGAWATLGGPLGRVENTARISGVSLSGGSTTRQPVVAWGERNGAVHRFVVRRWSPSGAWLEEGQPLPATGRAGAGLEGAVVVVDGERPTLASTVSTAVGAGSTDVSIVVRELR